MIFRLLSFVLCLGLGFAVTAQPQTLRMLWARLFSVGTKSTPVVKEVASGPSPTVPAQPPSLSQSLRAAVTMPPGVARITAMKQQEKALAALDPEAAMRLLMTLPPTLARDQMMRDAIWHLIDVDVAKAVAWAEKVPVLRQRCLWTMVEELRLVAVTDGPAAWALFERIKAMENGVAPDILIAAWAKERPEEAAQFGMALPVPGTRRYFMKTLLHEWAVEHTDSFVAWLQQQPTDMIVSYLREIPVTAMSESPEKLVQLAHALPSGLVGDDDWSNAIARAITEPSFLGNAADTIRQFPEGGTREGAMAAFIKALAAKDPVGAQIYLNELSEPASRAYAASQIAARLTLNDPAAGLAFVESQTDVLSREAATRSVLGTWIAERPAEGIAYLQDHLEELSTGGLSDLARVWAEKDPAGLVAFALNQATPEQREAIGSPVGEWVKHYPEKFLPILRAAMQRPGWQDAWEAIAQDTWFGLESNSVNLSALIEFIPSGATKQKAAEQLLYSWFDSDPAAANQWYHAQLAGGGLEPLPELSDTLQGHPVSSNPLAPPDTLGLEIFTYTGNGLSLTGYY